MSILAGAPTPTGCRSSRSVIGACLLSSLVLWACGPRTGASDDAALVDASVDIGGKGGPSNEGGGAGSGRNGGGGDRFSIDFGGRSGTSPDAREAEAGNAECRRVIAAVRDFKDTHVDFESFGNDSLQKGLVEATLDEDRKPRYDQSFKGLKSITDRSSHAQWYRDVPDVNERFSVELPLSEKTPGVFVFESNSFFPLDQQGFGNQKRNHNFHFTTEINGGFTYRGGEKFTFRGDDDVWVFVNNRLALDLGGVHNVQTATIDFDAQAAGLGIEKGKTYTFDVFHAERHTSASNFRMETTIQCLTVPVKVL